jgi:hypothetical protein
MACRLSESGQSDPVGEIGGELLGQRLKPDNFVSIVTVVHTF